MVGLVRIELTASSMSMKHSTNELKAHKLINYCKFFFWEKILVFLLTLYIKEKLIKNKVILKSEKKDPLGKSGKNVDNK